jgi:hypothetical protein
VVSLLAGRAGRDAFPATVLDLAARGWLVLDHQNTGQLACRLECAQDMVSVRLDGGPPENAALAPTRLAPVIAARPAAAAKPRRRPRLTAPPQPDVASPTRPSLMIVVDFCQIAHVIHHDHGR